MSQKKNTSGSQQKKNKGKSAETFENKPLDVSRPIRVLAILSLIGFLMSSISDWSLFFGIKTYAADAFGDNLEGQLAYMNNIQRWTKLGIDTSPTGLKDLTNLFLVLGLLNIPVLAGVGLLFFKVRAGFTIYSIFQTLYILMPIYYVGLNFYPAIRTLGYFDAGIMLLFIALYAIQRNNLGLDGNQPEAIDVK